MKRIGPQLTNILTKEILEEAYNRLNTITQVCEELNRDRWTIRKYLKEYSIPLKIKILPKEIFEEAYERLGTFEKVANEFNLTMASTYKYMTDYSIQPHTRTKYNFTKKQLIETYKRLGTVSKVALELNCGLVTMTKFFKKFKIKYKNTIKTELTKEQLEESYSRLGNVSAVAKEIGVKPDTIVKRMKKFKIEYIITINNTKFITSKEILEEALNRLERFDKVANEFNINITTLKKYIKIYNIPKKPLRNFTKKQLEESYNRLGNISSVAVELHTGTDTIQRYMKKFNISFTVNTKTKYNENLVKDFLINNKILFEKPYININTKKYFPDFYIKNINLFIEYNGTQHYRPVIFGSMTIKEAEDSFILQQTRDQNLRIYCKDNKINLLEIDGRKYYGKKLIMFLENYFLGCENDVY